MSHRVPIVRRIVHDRRGASAVEFALVAPLLLVLMFSIFEAGWIMTQSIMLDRALAKTVRDVQLKKNTVSYDDLKAKICDEALILAGCDKAIRIELTPITSSADFPSREVSCADRSAKKDSVESYDAGKYSQTVFARACFVVSPIIPGMGLALNLPKDKTGGVRLTSTFAFVNEEER